MSFFIELCLFQVSAFNKLNEYPSLRSTFRIRVSSFNLRREKFACPNVHPWSLQSLEILTLNKLNIDIFFTFVLSDACFFMELCTRKVQPCEQWPGLVDSFRVCCLAQANPRGGFVEIIQRDPLPNPAGREV